MYLHLAKLIRENTNEIFQVYIDAKDPSRAISASQARSLIRKLVAGLHAAGLKKGDCVCIHSFNDVKTFPSLMTESISLIHVRSTIL